MKSDYRVRATNFLHSIYPYIADCLFNYAAIQERINEYNKEKHRKVLLNMGSARFVLITSDYVIKWDYDEENVKELGGCFDEYEAYCRAIDEGYDYLLAAISLVTIDGHIFGIMPRIKCVGRCFHHGDIINYLTDDEYCWIIDTVNDIHHWNWGIRYGKACLIDYAMTNEVISGYNN